MKNMKEAFVTNRFSEDPHTFSLLPPKKVTKLAEVLDPVRPRDVYLDQETGEKFVEISPLNHLGEDNREIAQLFASLICKGTLNVSEAVPLQLDNGTYIVGSRVIDLSKTKPLAEQMQTQVAAERWILRYIFSESDHLQGSDNNINTSGDGRFALYDFARIGENFFFMGDKVSETRIDEAINSGVASILVGKLTQLNKIISDGKLIKNIFQFVKKYFPDASIDTMFFDAKGQTIEDFQNKLSARVQSALAQFQNKLTTQQELPN
jgi:hypothetical protein